MSSPSEKTTSSAPTTPEMVPSGDNNMPTQNPLPSTSTLDGDNTNSQEVAFQNQPQSPAIDGGHTVQEALNERDELALISVPEAVANDQSSSSNQIEVLHEQLLRTLIRQVVTEEFRRERVNTTLAAGETITITSSFHLPLNFIWVDIENLVPTDERLRENIAQRTREFTLAERLEGWIIERRRRDTRTIDTFYRHIRSQRFLRSLVEVVNFILYEAHPQDKKRKARGNAEPKSDQKRMKRSVPVSQKRARKANDLGESSQRSLTQFSDETEETNVEVLIALELLKLSICDKNQQHNDTSYKEDEKAPSPPSPPQREDGEASDPLDDNNASTAIPPADPEPNPSDQHEEHADNPPVDEPPANDPPVGSTEPSPSTESPVNNTEANPRAPEQGEGMNAAQVEGQGGEQEDAQGADPIEDVFEGLKPLDEPLFHLPDLQVEQADNPTANNPPVDSSEPSGPSPSADPLVDNTEGNPGPPEQVEGMNAAQAEGQGGEQEEAGYPEEDFFEGLEQFRKLFG